ncbi:MAG: F0F1 ATP synthase subunit B [Bacteroidales bacterium]|jgi:F-type H+-transporting ATPase subunit b|nr:F0F1 ATP synthase subunit B [Bacteroidales bacterium]MCK9448684.1 F0F1 ATP synthase subunit B [Bacteroidales bacterium]MDD3702221.1 F0F1 ATP synthase subunit B [Bacteroidales bacterium]MDY0368905.1 F0F1 ATP synthase subunit B [Bacteroidales bacterium]
MELVSPGFGLIFWMLLAFTAVFFILKKFAWPGILQGLKEREQQIDDALKAAEAAHQEMKNLKIDNEQLLKQAKEERDVILAEAKKIRDKLLDEARIKANEEAERIVQSAKTRIESERMAAITEIKNQIATISIEVAELILKEKLQEPEAHDQYIQRILEHKPL